MHTRGRLGLLLDADTDREIDNKCSGWQLPPACTEGEANEENSAVVQHAEWVQGGSARLSPQSRNSSTDTLSGLDAAELQDLE
ncbi:hypothetical protein HRR83_004535 [Exophiala dermatitidis]|uniref:Uncharacterized protein n=1 Tax=Exophiala dermatitidis TaxID=5970 RepID=A0AAN6EZ67_EXODE|nr:hypothetical protein HRR74_004184 [Exophiala dermatitidis]KAJ4529257.1 hypothetical protein HRR73_000279 [Exophiala dermatitidis]KAJ4544092.1 hypothetical protein HRR76_002162 [Exophiala dermatitidis]KAJ4549270.1 hypothetical protein HRR77_004141 [Exophiala dermatitidis]KAJ4575559.1 hypothetical protein HRR79_002473 [Exophiala dermatitidis]